MVHAIHYHSLVGWLVTEPPLKKGRAGICYNLLMSGDCDRAQWHWGAGICNPTACEGGLLRTPQRL